MAVHAIGTPFAGGGTSLRLHDLARVGRMIRNDGTGGGRQVVPAAAVAEVES